MPKIYFDTSDIETSVLAAMLTEPIGEEGESLFSLMNKLKLTDQKKYLLWEAIINDMQIGAIDGLSAKVSHGDLINHKTPIRAEDILLAKQLPEGSEGDEFYTLIDLIASMCDLPDDNPNAEPILKSKLFENLLNSDNSSFWNESINELAEQIYELFIGNDNIVVLEIEDDKNITITTLKEADAGNNFNPNSSDLDKWVIPWWNIDKKNYDQVRWTDQITDILLKGNKLQYTNNHSKWITLLMPQYGRRVEIEDLDRNFWIIAEVIDGISSWIFDTSPIPEIIKKLIDEVTQLWENLIYLWAQIALMNQKKDDTVRVISFIQTSNTVSRFNPTRYGSIPTVLATYENNQFSIKRAGDGGSTSSIIGYNPVAQYYQYEKQYSESTLCFIPLTRVNVYHKNYYCGDLYDRITISKLGKVSTSEGERVQRERKNYTLWEQYNDNGDLRNILISPRETLEPTDTINGKESKRFSPYIYGTRFAGNKYEYIYPFSKTPASYVMGNSVYLYGTLRTIPHITFTSDEEGNVVISDFIIEVHDAAAKIIENERDPIGKTDLIGTYRLDHITDDNKIILKYEKNISDEIVESRTTSAARVGVLNEEYCENIHSAYYLGEVASWREKTAVIKESKNLFKNDAILLKIGNFLPAPDRNIAESYRNAFFKGISDSKTIILPTQMRGNFTLRSNPKSSSIYFYEPIWESYDANKDIPDKVSSTKPDFCFSAPPKQVDGGIITDQYLARQGMIAVQNYILKTKGVTGHPHNELWRTPCFFMTFVGLTPWWGNSGGQMYWDIAMTCHVYKYIPSMASMKQRETVGDNYVRAYNDIDTIIFTGEDGKELSGAISIKGEEIDIEIGKIVSCNFINRFESYYDAQQFKGKMIKKGTAQKEPVRGSIFIGDGWRAIKAIGAINEDLEYCRLLSIDGGAYYAYDVKFSTTYEGIIQYYDAARAVAKGDVGTFLTDSSIGTKYQVSEGYVSIGYNEDGTSFYEQIDNGLGQIRPSDDNGTGFEVRRKKTAKYIEKSSTETTFLLRDSDKEEEQKPFIWDTTAKDYKPLIYKKNLTPNSRFGAWTDGDGNIHTDDNYIYFST